VLCWVVIDLGDGCPEVDDHHLDEDEPHQPAPDSDLELSLLLLLLLFLLLFLDSAPVDQASNDEENGEQVFVLVEVYAFLFPFGLFLHFAIDGRYPACRVGHFSYLMAALYLLLLPESLASLSARVLNLCRRLWTRSGHLYSSLRP